MSPSDRLTGRSRTVLLGVLFVGVLMAALDIAIVGPALTAVGARFGVTPRSLQWVTTVYILFNVVGTPLMAKLSDLYGRRAIYALDVLLFALGSIVAALSGTFEGLLVGRGIQGFGAAGIFPVASAVIGDTFPPERRGRALGLIGAVWGLAFIVGPLAGIGLLAISWQAIFLVNVPFALVVLALAVRVLPTARHDGPVRFDWTGMALLGVLLAALTFGISQIDSSHLAASLVSPSVLPFLLLALAVLPAFWLVEGRAADPIVRPDLLKRRQLVVADVLSAGTGLGESSMVFIPSLAVALLGMNNQAASAMLLPVVLTMTFGTPLVGRLLDRVGSRSIVVVGGLLLAVGTLLLGTAATSPSTFVVAGVLIGAGFSALLGTPMRYIVLNESATRDRAAAQAVLTVAGSVGMLVGGALIGAIATSQGGGAAGYMAAYRAIGIVGIVVSLGGLLLKGRAAERASVAERAAE